MEPSKKEHTQKPDLKFVLKETLLEYHREEKIDDGIWNAQQLVIARLPSDSETEIIGAVSADTYLRDGVVDPEVLVAGALFELLVRSDFKICFEEAEEAKRLRTLLANPGVFRFTDEGRESLSNPDFLGITQAGYITKVVEAKAGFLGNREVRQLASFITNLKGAIEDAKKIPYPELKRNGLGFVKENGGIKIGHDLKVTLAVPRGRLVHGPKSLLKSDVFNGQGMQEALKVLRGTDIKESVFSGRELHEMTKAVLSTILVSF